MSFADVLCQACGFAGPPRLFAAGCPVCGNTAASAAPKPKGGAPQRFAAEAPPAWAYLLAILAFVGILALLLTK
jgi:hypothetical protein